MYASRWESLIPLSSFAPHFDTLGILMCLNSWGFFYIFDLHVKAEVTRGGKIEMNWEAVLHHFVTVEFSSPFSSWCFFSINNQKYQKHLIGFGMKSSNWIWHKKFYRLFKVEPFTGQNQLYCSWSCTYSGSW